MAITASDPASLLPQTSEIAALEASFVGDATSADGEVNPLQMMGDDATAEHGEVNPMLLMSGYTDGGSSDDGSDESPEAPAAEPDPEPEPAVVAPAPQQQASAVSSATREIVWEAADDGDLVPDWMAVKAAGWTEAPSGFDDGESLVGRRVFVLDEGFGTVKRHKARKRGGGMTTVDFDGEGSKTVCLRLAGNKSNTTSWMAKPSAFAPGGGAPAPARAPAPAPAPAPVSIQESAATSGYDADSGGDDIFSRMKAQAEEAERRLTHPTRSKPVKSRTDSYRDLEVEVESDLIARMQEKAEAALQAKIKSHSGSGASDDEAPPPRTESFETAGDDVFARMQRAAEEQEAKLLGQKVAKTVSPPPRLKRLDSANLKSSLKPSSLSPVSRPVAAAEPKGPAPRKAKKASALKGKKGKRSGGMHAVADTTADDEPEEVSSEGEEWKGYDDVETPPTSDDEDEIGADTGLLFDDMFGGMAPAKPKAAAPEAKTDSEDDSDEDDPAKGQSAAQELTSTSGTESDEEDSTKASAEYTELNGKFQNMLMEVEMLKLKLEREQSQKKDYIDNCLRLENELETSHDDIEKLTQVQSDITDKLRTAMQEDFNVPATASAVESLDGDSELSKAMATAAAGLRTEDIWEGSAKFISLTERFGKFMANQAEANGVDSCVVEFVFAPELSKLLGGIEEKSFKVSAHNQICQILSLVCSRLHVPNSQMYEISTLRGFELDKDKSLSSYGLGALFKRWIVKLSVPVIPVGTDPVEDEAMVRSLLDDHLNQVWESIAQQEATRLDEEEAASKAQWENLDARYSVMDRFLGMSQDGRRKALAFIMQVQREEEADRLSMKHTAGAARGISEGDAQPVFTRKYKQNLISSMFNSIPLLGNADTTDVARDLQAHLRLDKKSEGSRVIHEGFVTDDMWFVVEGELRRTAKGKRLQETVRPGSWCGEKALFIGNERPTISYDAHGDVLLYRVSRSDFMAVLMRHPGLESMIEQLTAEMFGSEQDSVSHQNLTAAERAELAITTTFVSQVPMFHGLTDPLCVEAVAARLTPVSIAANAVVCEKGNVGQEMYFVREGYVEMLPELDQPAFGQKGPGSFFGEMALLNSEPRNAFCRCLTEISGYVLTKSDLQRVLLEFPAMEALVRRPLIERDTERAREIGEMMAATATTLSRKELRRQAANTLQKAGRRFVERRLEIRVQREQDLEVLRLSECVPVGHCIHSPTFVPCITRLTIPLCCLCVLLQGYGHRIGQLGAGGRDAISMQRCAVWR